MPYLFSRNRIVRKDENGHDDVIPKRTVFLATVAEAKELDKQGAASPATPEQLAPLIKAGLITPKAGAAPVSEAKTKASDD